MYQEIPWSEFCNATKGCRPIGGGEMFSGGTYSEYRAGSDFYRYEISVDGVESWYRFIPSSELQKARGGK